MYANFMSEKSRFLKQKHIKKVFEIVLILTIIKACLLVLKTKNSRPMLSSKYVVCHNKLSRSMKEQEGKILLRSVGFKTPLNRIMLLGKRLF